MSSYGHDMCVCMVVVHAANTNQGSISASMLRAVVVLGESALHLGIWTFDIMTM